MTNKELRKLRKKAKKARKLANAKPFTAKPDSDAFLSSFEWRRLRLKVLQKYGSTCMCCGDSPANGAIINVDHIKPRKLFPELALTESNLQVLCNVCNHGKGNWNQTDWRPKEQENEFDPLRECMDRMRLG